MAMSFTGRKRIRRSFGRLAEVAQMPNLIEVQKTSYDAFLQTGIPMDQREKAGLQEVFSSVFPIKDFSDRSRLEFVRYELERPKYDVEECRQRGLTYTAQLKVSLRLVVWDVDEETGSRSLRDIKEQEVYMGDIPLMTEHGTFIVNGTERVIVSQMHRSPGVFFDHDKGKTHSSGKYLFAARVIPYRGSWLDFEFDAKDLVYVRIDRRRKLPATTLLLALDNAETAAKREELALEGEQLDPGLAQGMSKEDILSAFYEKITYTLTKSGWKTPFDAERLRGQKLTHDLIDAKSGEVIVEAESKITPRLIRKLADAGVKDVLARQDDLIGRFVAEDLIDEKTGLVIVEAGDELTEENLQQLVDNGIVDLPTLHIDRVNVGPWIRNTLAADKNASREDALIDIYRVMRPGEPLTLETAEALFRSLFFDSERYDLSAVGRGEDEFPPGLRAGFGSGHDPDAAPRRHPVDPEGSGRTEGRQGRNRRHRPPGQPPGAFGRRADGEPVPHRPAAHGARDPRTHELGRYRQRHAARLDQCQAGGRGGTRILRLLAAVAVYGPDQPAVGSHA